MSKYNLHKTPICMVTETMRLVCHLPQMSAPTNQSNDSYAYLLSNPTARCTICPVTRSQCISYVQLPSKVVRLAFLFPPRFVCPIPSALYHTAGKRGDISLISPSFSRRVISWKMRVISWKMRVISWEPW